MDLHVLARPRARQDRVEVEVLDGQRLLVVHVKAPPDKNKANVAILKLLASLLAVPQSSLAIVRGHTSQEKIVRVSGVDEARVAAAIDAMPRAG